MDHNPKKIANIYCMISTILKFDKLLVLKDKQ
jgi:hypothetical protein